MPEVTSRLSTKNIMEQNRKPRDKSMDTLSLTKEARIYNGEKTISLTSGAGKTGQIRSNQSLSHVRLFVTP